jgi:hypothetical protein
MHHHTQTIGSHHPSSSSSSHTGQTSFSQPFSSEVRTFVRGLHFLLQYFSSFHSSKSLGICVALGMPIEAASGHQKHHFLSVEQKTVVTFRIIRDHRFYSVLKHYNPK